MFAATRSGRVYSLVDLTRAVAGGSADGGSPIDDLIDSKLAWNDAMRDRSEALHVHVPRDGEQVQSGLSAVLVDTLVVDLVIKDCKGSVSVYSDQQAYAIETLPSCETIKSNLTARSLGGVSMHDEPARALAYAAERCAQGLALHFDGDDGRTLELPCAQPIGVPPNIVVPDTVF